MANSQIPPGSGGTIPVPLAKEQVTNWYDYLALETTDITAKSFLFDLEVVKSLIADTPEANGMRIYPALKKAGDLESITLLLVPTLDGQDIIKTPTPPGGVGDDPEDSKVYNYATTCPPTCGPGSGLPDA